MNVPRDHDQHKNKVIHLGEALRANRRLYNVYVTDFPYVCQMFTDAYARLAAMKLFALVVYAQLILENARLYAGDVGDDLIDQIFDCLVRDFSKHALQLYSKPSSSPHQMELCLRMLRKPVVDTGRFNRVWEQVHALKYVYGSG